MKNSTQGNQSEARLAYLAGIIDGEGCITLYRNRDARSPNGYFVAAVKCNMCERQAIDLLYAEFGGSIGLVSARRKNQRDAFGWQLYGRKKIMPCLQKLLPYLRVKREIALLVLEYCETHPGYKHFSRISDSELRRREELFQKVKKLIRPARATTESSDPERGCDSLASQETVREGSEEVPPPSEKLH